jgi:SAM-dependent methyltransferase
LGSVDWDKRYREGFYEGATEPHGLLKKFWSAIPIGPTIDIAMGNGRDASFLAGKGLRVWGIEKSSEAIGIAKNTSINKGHSMFIILGDANALPFKKGSATCVMVFYFLLRNKMGELVDLLKEGGILIYETFLKRQNMIDGWRDPEHLLDDGELLSYFNAIDPVFYEETVSLSDGKRRAVAKYVGRKR